jgi:ribonucleoside-diphosphate reductase alpha chain
MAIEHNVKVKQPNLTPLAEEILMLRYLKKDDDGNFLENPGQLFLRVAENIAKADLTYMRGKSDKEKEEQYSKTTKEFYNAMINLDFLPASPILMNAGNTLQQLFSDYVFVLRDSMKNIFGKLTNAAVIQQKGAGCGFSFSKIRPKRDIVSGQQGVAFGPVTVMKFFDVAIGSIKQGGRRQGGNMGVLHVSHPDIVNFIKAKEDGSLKNFNISVAITDEFMEAVKEDRNLTLINPRIGLEVKKVAAKEVLNALTHSIWKAGDPGVLFIDEMNEKNPIKETVFATGSCGQSPMHSWEGVPYAHINLSKIVKERKNKGVIAQLDLSKLKKLIHLGVHFLDNCIDLNNYQFKKSEQRCKAFRRIGLGVMGFSDLLVKLRIAYDSEEALFVVEKIMTVVQEESRKASLELAVKRKKFKNYSRTIWKDLKMPLRNVSITTIAPTGSTSMIANTSAGIEPLFALSYSGKTTEGQEYVVTNGDFEHEIQKLNVDEKRKLLNAGSIKNNEEVPVELRKVFVTAMDIHYKWHIKVQAAFQKYIDSAISKTINMHRDVTENDIAEALILAHSLKCKGLTIYRDKSREDQILELRKTQTKLDSF